MKYIAFLLLLTQLSCEKKPQEIDIATAVNLMGKHIYEVDKLIKDTKWSLESEGLLNVKYIHSYRYKNKDSNFAFMIFHKCNQNPNICGIDYSISELDYTTIIPEGLKKINFTLLDEYDIKSTHRKDFTSKVQKLNCYISLSKKKIGNSYYYAVSLEDQTMPELKDVE